MAAKKAKKKKSRKTPPRYYQLVIKATKPSTKIWVGDDMGHLVVADTGLIDEGLMKGNYTVEFRLGGTTYPIKLTSDSKYTQAEIEAGPSCPRPKLRFLKSWGKSNR